VNANRKIARIVGVLFITIMVAGLLSTVFSEPIHAPDYLINVSANENQVIIGALFSLIMAVGLAGVAITVYPILKKHNEALALGYVGATIIDGVLFIASILARLTLLTLSKEFVEAGAPHISYFQTTGALLLAVHDWAYNVLWPITVGLGALMFYYLLYQSKLIPRCLSVWGFIGAILFPAASVSEFFILPLVVNEFVLAVWLIVKGFKTSVNTSESARPFINKD